MHRLVAGRDVALGEHRVTAVEIADVAARLAHQDDAGGHVPGRKVALPVGIDAAGRDPGKIEGGGAEAAQAHGLLLHMSEFLAELREPAAPPMRERAGNDRILEPAARGHAQAAIVEERALAAFGGEEFAGL
jgi:hypothetical protein